MKFNFLLTAILVTVSQHHVMIQKVAGRVGAAPNSRSMPLEQESTNRIDEPRLVEIRKIWDQSPHNAFTDLIRFQGTWLCVFREGAGHVSADGVLRIIQSTDGKDWKSVGLIASASSDLRDAKITLTPAGELMLSGAEALHDKSKMSHQSLAWFSKNGSEWSDRVVIGDPNFWLWRVQWLRNKAYAIGYCCGDVKSVRLYESSDGKSFKSNVENLGVAGYPNESAIVFDGNIAYCLLRRDGEPSSGLIGTAAAPFTEWSWKELGVKIGGPALIRLPDGRLMAAVRLYDQSVRTSLCWVDPVTGTLSECLTLPSGGDCSYAGMVFHEGMLWVSYYSSHEGKSAIYLAKVSIPEGVAN